MKRLRTKPKGMSWAAWHRYRSCESKRRFEHEGDARRKAHRSGQVAYLCMHCDGWHLTTSKERS